MTATRNRGSSEQGDTVSDPQLQGIRILTLATRTGQARLTMYGFQERPTCKAVVKRVLV